MQAVAVCLDFIVVEVFLIATTCETMSADLLHHEFSWQPTFMFKNIDIQSVFVPKQDQVGCSTLLYLFRP